MFPLEQTWAIVGLACPVTSPVTYTSAGEGEWPRELLAVACAPVLPDSGVELDPEATKVVVTRPLRVLCSAVSDKFWGQVSSGRSSHFRQPTFQTTCAMSLAVLTVSSMRLKTPSFGPGDSTSSHGMNMPDEVLRMPAGSES